MKYSELTNEQKGAIIPVFFGVYQKDNLHDFVEQVFQLSKDCETKCTIKEQQTVKEFYNCLSNLYGAKLEKNPLIGAIQIFECIPTFIDLLLSDDLENACKSFKNSSVWYSIIIPKRSIRIIILELELNQNKDLAA